MILLPSIKKIIVDIAGKIVKPTRILLIKFKND